LGRGCDFGSNLRARCPLLASLRGGPRPGSTCRPRSYSFGAKSFSFLLVPQSLELAPRKRVDRQQRGQSTHNDLWCAGREDQAALGASGHLMKPRRQASPACPCLACRNKVVWCGICESRSYAAATCGAPRQAVVSPDPNRVRKNLLSVVCCLPTDPSTNSRRGTATCRAPGRMAEYVSRALGPLARDRITTLWNRLWLSPYARSV